MIRTAVTISAAAIALASVAGCAALPAATPGGAVATSEPPRASVADRQVALDFVNAIVQLVEPHASPLRFADAREEPVSSAIRAMLANAGYDVGSAERAVGARTVSHRVAVVESAGERLERHDVVVGDVQLRRSYRSTGTGTVLPASGLFVRGADAASVRTMDEELFDAGGAGGRDVPVPLSRNERLASYRPLLMETEAGIADAADVSADTTTASCAISDD